MIHVQDIPADLDPSLFRKDFVLQLPSLSEVDNAVWTTRLGELARECGCSMGARFVVAYGAIVPFAAGAALLRWHTPILFALLLAFAGVIVVAAAGKTLGITVARVRLRRAIAALSSGGRRA